MSDPEREREKKKSFVWLFMVESFQNRTNSSGSGKAPYKKCDLLCQEFFKEIVNSDIIYSHCYANPYDLLSSVKLKKRASKKVLFWGEAFH